MPAMAAFFITCQAFSTRARISSTLLPVSFCSSRSTTCQIGWLFFAVSSRI